MAKLEYSDRQILEHVLGMKSGYVLDISNTEFGHLIYDATGIDVYGKGWDLGGTSKANRLRRLWERENSHTVAKALDALLQKEERYPETYRIPPVNDRDRADCRAIVEKLRTSTDVNALPALNVGNCHATFTLVRDEVKRYIDEGRFDSGIDRLHTFVTQYLRLLIEKRTGSAPSDSLPLHSLMGSYSKLVQESASPTEMTMRILKTSISTLEAFNPIRNDQSLAHPNDVTVQQHEARLIFAHVIALIGFIEEIERDVKSVVEDDDIPF